MGGGRWKTACRPFVLAVVAAALCSVAVHAQNGKGWDDPYEKGLKSFQAKKYQEAIAEFEEAVRTNSKAEAYKLIEGVHHTDYFPYYYLGIAYFETGDYVKAAANFQKAKNPQPSDKKLVATLNDYVGRIPSTTTTTPTNPPRPTQPPAPSAAYTNALISGDAALQGKHWQDATVAYDQAKAADSAAYQAGNVQAKRDQAVHSWASDLNNDGHALLATSLNQAKAKFTQAEQLVPGSATDGMNQVQQRETTYQQAKGGIETDITAKNFKAAKDKLDRARAASPEQFTIDKLEARLTVVNAGLAAPVNTNTLNNVPSNVNTVTPGTKDTTDKNAKLPSSVTAPDTTKDSLRTALLALANGDAQNSITILEPIQQAAGPATAAALHAYLGVAYATRAFSSAKSDEQSRLSDKALEQFKLALSSQRDFQLSRNIVSPKILQMFEQARR
jgi:tetratricopeptide (TPR) repeat protein